MDFSFDPGENLEEVKRENSYKGPRTPSFNQRRHPMVLYRILISVTVIVVLYWIWNYVTNVYAAVLVSAGLVLAVAAYILTERETDKK